MAGSIRLRLAWASAAAIVGVAALVASLPRAGDDAAVHSAPSISTPRAAGDAVSSRGGRRRADVPAASVAPSAPTFRVAVTVLRADGTPAAGATVLLLQTGAPQDEPPRAQADAAGVASFETPNRKIRAFAWLGDEAAAGDETAMPADAPRLVVRLTPAVRVRGHVRTDEEAPVAGACVVVSDADEAHGPDRLRLSVRADADGRFEMPPLPLALVDSGAGSEVEAFADGFLGQAESVDRTQVKEGDVILELEQGIAIRGQVVGPDGVPVAGAEARIDDDIRATTDASGRFVLTLLRDENRRIVVCRTRRRPARPGHNDNDAIQRITATALGPFDADTDVGVVHLSQGRRLRGRVVDRSGAAVRGANVILGIPGVGLDSDTSDAEGRFEFADVGADAYDVGAYEYSNAPRTVIGRHAGVTGVRAGDAEVLVALTGATSVVIRFFDELRHEPIAVRDIRLRGVLHGTKEPHEEQHWNGPLEAVRFELQKPGSFDVSIASPGFEPQTVENVESFVDRESTLDVVLRKTSK